MNKQLIKDFVKSKKGKTMIAGAIGAAVLHFFPGSTDAIAEWTHVLAEIFTEAADKVDPVIIKTIQ